MVVPGFTSVIIPIYALDRSAVKMARGCVEAFREATEGEQYELIVVSNGSIGALDEIQPLVDCYLRLDPNQGFSGGVNAGIRISRGEYLAIGSADTYPRPGWLGPMRRAAEAGPGVATPMEEDGRGNLISEHGKRGRRRGDFFGNLWVMPRSLIEAVGYLDEQDFKLRLGDTDYAIRTAIAGYWVGRVPEARVVQVARHHALSYMDEGDVLAEDERLIAKYGHRFYAQWRAANP